MAILSLILPTFNQAQTNHNIFVNSAVIELGNKGDFDKTGAVLLANPKAWGPVDEDGRIPYRTVNPETSAELLFVAFEVDESGLSKHDLVLEIFYRDDVKAEAVSEYKIRGKIVIESRIDFTHEHEYVEIGHLQTKGDGGWKLEQILLEKTPRQMVRAIDGSFQFRIVMPASGFRSLPVSYVRLSSVSHQDFIKYREEQRAKRGFERIDYHPTTGRAVVPENWRSQGFVVYPANYLRLVFPNSPVDYERAGADLSCFEIPGGSEPVTFVVYAYEDLNDVNVSVSELMGPNSVIAAHNIEIRRVVYNDQRLGWSKSRYYCTCPDYLSPTDPKGSIKADTNCQFWLTVNIPEQASSGLYIGKVSIAAQNKQPYSIPLRVDVLPVILRENKKKHMVYHSPYFKKFHPDPKRVLVDMKKHGLVPVFYPGGELIKTGGGLDIKLDDFEYQLKSFRDVYPKTKELFVVIFNYYSVWRMLEGDEPVCAGPSLKFEEAYGRILRAYSDLARHYGLELYFSFQDEPFKDIEKRRTAYYCSQIAQRNGLRTWSTQHLDTDVQLVTQASKLVPFPGYTRPLREVLDVFAESAGRVEENLIGTLKEDGSKLSYYTTPLATSIWPVYNRLLHGIYPFVVGANFVVSYAYRDSMVDPYDDCDAGATILPAVGYSDYLLTYPTWQSDILPTLCYEALREGIEDSELISTLQSLAEKALQDNDYNTINLGKEANRYLDGVLKRVSRNFRYEYYRRHEDLPVDPMEKAILKDLNNGQGEEYAVFDKIRREVCDRIVSLQSALTRSN